MTPTTTTASDMISHLRKCVPTLVSDNADPDTQGIVINSCLEVCNFLMEEYEEDQFSDAELILIQAVLLEIQALTGDEYS